MFKLSLLIVRYLLQAKYVEIRPLYGTNKITGFVRVLENLESPRILGKSWKKATGPGMFWKFVKLG